MSPITTTMKTLTVLLATRVVSAAYTVQTTMVGDCFLNHFNFYDGGDPTHGFVTYVDKSTALSSKMLTLRDHALANNSIYIGVDATTVLSSSGPGRNAVRLQGTDLFTHGIITLDVYHAPTGCGTWPALWLVNPTGQYPGTTGEIDIFEAVNNGNANAVTLHTSQGCNVQNSGAGALRASDCWVDAPGSGNSGCSVVAPSTVSYAATSAAVANTTFNTAGTGFNTQNGGLYALVWTDSLIEAYFFPRPLIPQELLPGHAGGNRTTDPATWKAQGFQPIASFSGCDFDQHLANLALIINTDFCGGWAEANWGPSGCAASTGQATCASYVAANPQAFSEAYWLLGGAEIWASS